MIKTLLVVVLVAFAVATPCTPPTNNQWGGAERVLEILGELDAQNVLESVAPKTQCFMRDTCAVECKGGTACRIFNGRVKGKNKTRKARNPAAFFDITNNAAMMDAKRRICESGRAGKKKAKQLGVRLQDDLYEYMGKYTKKKHVNKYRRKTIGKIWKNKNHKYLDTIVPKKSALRKFYMGLLADRTCERMQSSGGVMKYEPPPKFVEKWNHFLDHEVPPKVKAFDIYRTGGLRLAYNTYLYGGLRCKCGDLLKYLKKTNKKNADALKEIKAAEVKIRQSGVIRCKPLVNECKKKALKIKLSKKMYRKVNKIGKGIKKGIKKIGKGFKKFGKKIGRFGKKLGKKFRKGKKGLKKIKNGLKKSFGKIRNLFKKAGKVVTPVKPIKGLVPYNNIDGPLKRLMAELVIESEAK